MTRSGRIVVEDDILDATPDDLSELYSSAFGRAPSPESLTAIFENCFTSSTAWDGDRLAGAVYAISDGVLDATIHGLAVHQDYQKRGIATRLMEHILGKLKDVSILLTTETEYVDFYERWGFRRHLSTMALRFPKEETD